MSRSYDSIEGDIAKARDDLATTLDEIIDRVNAFLDYLGNPHRTLTSIHIAGTNGKGSTAHMLAAIYQSNGYKTGLFTSPHLISYRERMKINREYIPEEYVLSWVQKHFTYLSREPLSFFEMSMGLSCSWFQDEKIDIAIMETGLGGRLDATNVCRPLVCVITTVSRDHTELLGRTLDEALWETSRRLDIPEFKFFAISLSVQRETGGNLAETLENLSNILRARRTYGSQNSYVGGLFTDRRFEEDGGGELVAQGDGAAEVVMAHVVEQENIEADEGQKGGDLVESIGFDFDLQRGMPCFDRGDAGSEIDGAGVGDEVVVFHHDGVVEAHAVVPPASVENGRLFQLAPSGGGLAGVEKLRGGAVDGVDEGAGDRGDAAETLQKIQNSALGGEDKGIIGGRHLRREAITSILQRALGGRVQRKYIWNIAGGVPVLEVISAVKGFELLRKAEQIGLGLVALDLADMTAV